MKKLIFSLALVLASFNMTNFAEASPKHKRNHYSTNVEQPSFFEGLFSHTEQTVNKTRRAVVRETTSFVGFGSDLASRARNYVGATAGQLGLSRRLWCADFMNMITGSGSDRRARSYLSRGTPAPYGCTNCIAVTSRRGGGHVGVITGYDQNGNPIIVSGNHGHRVAESVYNKRRVIGYRYI